MPYTLPELSRPPSRELVSPFKGMTRRLSIEETYHLADTARRKSSEKVVREDLRLKLQHTNFLEMLLQDIALNEKESKKSPPPSPTQSTVNPERHISWDQSIPTGVDEFGYGFEDDGEEDLEGLSLTKTVSRRPRR